MALEIQWIDDQLVTGAFVGVTTKTVTVTPTFPHQPGRVLLVLLAWHPTLGAGEGSISSLTVNGQAATLVELADQGEALAAIYRFDNPPAIASFDVVVNWDPDGVTGAYTVVLVEQADMSSPIKASGTHTGTGTGPSTVALGTLEPEELAFGTFAQFNATTTTATTIGGGFSSFQNSLAGASPQRTRSIQTYQQGAGVAVTSSFTPAASKPFAHAAVVMRGVHIVPLRGFMGAGI